MAIIEKPIAGTSGDLMWNLKSTEQFSVGTELPTVFYIFNREEEPKEFMLMAAVFRYNTQITEFPVVIDDKAWFTIAGRTAITVPASLMCDYTDCLLTVYLIERETENQIDYVQTALYMPAQGFLPVQPSPTSEASNWIAMIMMIAVMGIMGKVISGKEKEENGE